MGPRSDDRGYVSHRSTDASKNNTSMGPRPTTGRGSTGLYIATGECQVYCILRSRLGRGLLSLTWLESRDTQSEVARQVLHHPAGLVNNEGTLSQRGQLWMP
jgi:hypothetical protein